MKKINRNYSNINRQTNLFEIRQILKKIIKEEIEKMQDISFDNGFSNPKKYVKFSQKEINNICDEIDDNNIDKIIGESENIEEVILYIAQCKNSSLTQHQIYYLLGSSEHPLEIVKYIPKNKLQEFFKQNGSCEEQSISIERDQDAFFQFFAKNQEEMAKILLYEKDKLNCDDICYILKNLTRKYSAKQIIEIILRKEGAMLDDKCSLKTILDYMPPNYNVKFVEELLSLTGKYIEDENVFLLATHITDIPAKGKIQIRKIIRDTIGEKRFNKILGPH